MKPFATLFEDHLGTDAIVAYVDGELSLTAYQRAAAHLHQCPMCAAEVGEQSFARNCLRTAASPAMPMSLLARLDSIPVALPASAVSRGVALDPETGSAVRTSVSHRNRRLRFGAGALVAGLAVGALATSSANPDPAPSTPLNTGRIQPASVPLVTQPPRALTDLPTPHP